MYDLGKDPEGLKKEMEEMGYTKVKIWYQPTNYNFENFEEYFVTMYGAYIEAGMFKNMD